MISQGETTFFFVKINGLIAELKMELNRSPTDLELQRRLEQAAAVMIQAAARKMICRAAFRRARLMMNDGRKVQTPIARPRFPKPGNKAKAGVDAAQESSPTLLQEALKIDPPADIVSTLASHVPNILQGIGDAMVEIASRLSEPFNARKAPAARLAPRPKPNVGMAARLQSEDIRNSGSGSVIDISNAPAEVLVARTPAAGDEGNDACEEAKQAEPSERVHVLAAESSRLADIGESGDTRTEPPSEHHSSDDGTATRFTALVDALVELLTVDTMAQGRLMDIIAQMAQMAEAAQMAQMAQMAPSMLAQGWQDFGGGRHLLKLDLCGRGLGCEAGKRIAAALAAHPQLTALDVSRNALGLAGCTPIVNATRSHRCLTSLDLGDNHFPGPSLGAPLRELLVHNSVLTRLSLYKAYLQVSVQQPLCVGMPCRPSTSHAARSTCRKEAPNCSTAYAPTAP